MYLVHTLHIITFTKSYMTDFSTAKEVAQHCRHYPQ